MRKDFTITDSLLDSAKRSFLEHGYDQVSMDQIAAEAGTTKRTLYSHFGSKEKLFAAVIGHACRRAANNLKSPSDYDDDAQEAVVQFCLRHAYWSSWTDAIALQRVLIALAPRFPQYIDLLYREAMQGAEQVLADYLTGHVPQSVSVPWGDFMSLARSLLYAVSNERRLLSLFNAIEPYPAPSNATPFRFLPEEKRIRHLVALFLKSDT